MIEGHPLEVFELIGDHREGVIRDYAEHDISLGVRSRLLALLAPHPAGGDQHVARLIQREPPGVFEIVNNRLWHSGEVSVELGEPHQPPLVGLHDEQASIVLDSDADGALQAGKDDGGAEGRLTGSGEPRREPIEDSRFAIGEEQVALRVDDEAGGLLKSLRDNLVWGLRGDRGGVTEGRRGAYQAGHEDPGPAQVDEENPAVAPHYRYCSRDHDLPKTIRTWVVSKGIHKMSKTFASMWVPSVMRIHCIYNIAESFIKSYINGLEFPWSTPHSHSQNVLESYRMR